MHLRWLALCLCALRYRAPLNTGPCRILVKPRKSPCTPGFLVRMVKYAPQGAHIQVGLCRMVIYEATEYQTKTCNSYRRSTCIGHLGPLGCDVQHDENRQYAPNQALRYVVWVHMRHHRAWVRQCMRFYAPSKVHKKNIYISLGSRGFEDRTGDIYLEYYKHKRSCRYIKNIWQGS